MNRYKWKSAVVAVVLMGAFWPSPSTAAPTTHFQLSGLSPTTTSGLFEPVTVTALDSSDAVVLTYAGTVHFTTTDSLALLPVNYTFILADSGIHTFSVELVSLGLQTISVIDTANSELSGSISTTVLSPAAPVPEPETYVMLLAGLGLLGFAARRRNQKAV